MISIPPYLVDLHRSLDQRLRPEEVITLIHRGCPAEQQIRSATSRYSWSSMSDDFARPVGGARQLASAAKAFQQDMPLADPDDSEHLRNIAIQLGAPLAWTPENKTHLTRRERAAAGVTLSRRAYNRQFRALMRIARKANTLDTQHRVRRALLIGRSGFVADITLERFAQDPAAAHFIAYWVARKNLRRQFTLSGKHNPMDVVADELLRHCERRRRTDWAMIALVRSTPDVLVRLTPEQQGDLLARWFTAMRDGAEILAEIWTPAINRQRMIVQKGNDSSTWNTIAQSYNTARASWLACVSALGAGRLLMGCCPGKVMRLMAADLAYWHRARGRDLDPDTQVWATLPLPWEVVNGTAICTVRDVLKACAQAGLDPRQSGWIAPRPPGSVAPLAFTPELVHGVSVADPLWASILRRAGVFSGKHITTDADLARAAAVGLAQGVVTSDLPSHTPVRE